MVRLRIHDLDGRLVRILHEGILPAGVQKIVWDGRDAQGRRARAGVYYYRLRAGEKVEAGQVVVLR